MLDFTERTITPLLSPGETFLWSGKPRAGLIFRRSDWIQVPFSLIWCAIASVVLSQWWTGPLPDKLLSAVFVLVGLYMLIGRFVFDAMLRANTTYGLTDQRAIIVKRLFSNDVTSVSMRTWGDFDFALDADGSGTITFGAPPPMFRSRGAPPPSPAFEAIDDASRVYGLVRDAQQKAQAT